MQGMYAWHVCLEYIMYDMYARIYYAWHGMYIAFVHTCHVIHNILYIHAYIHDEKQQKEHTSHLVLSLPKLLM